MKTFFQSIPKKLRLKSDSLDASAILCGKAWHVFTDDGIMQKLFFREKGKLLLITSGIAQDATWEFVPEDRSIIIDNGEQRKNFQPAFYDDCLLVLQVDGTDESLLLIDCQRAIPFAFRNLQEIDDYLKKRAQLDNPSDDEPRDTSLPGDITREQNELDKINEKKKEHLREQYKDEIFQGITRRIEERDSVQRCIMIPAAIVLIFMFVLYIIYIIFYI